MHDRVHHSFDRQKHNERGECPDLTTHVHTSLTKYAHRMSLLIALDFLSKTSISGCSVSELKRGRTSCKEWDLLGHICAER